MAGYDIDWGEFPPIPSEQERITVAFFNDLRAGMLHPQIDPVKNKVSVGYTPSGSWEGASRLEVTLDLDFYRELVGSVGK